MKRRRSLVEDLKQIQKLKRRGRMVKLIWTPPREIGRDERERLDQAIQKLWKSERELQAKVAEARKLLREVLYWVPYEERAVRAGIAWFLNDDWHQKARLERHSGEAGIVG